MIKVCKFGGSSLASGEQFKKVKDIVKGDETRCVVVVSAPGRRFEGDSKITDLLYLCHAHLKYGVSYESIFELIEQRYCEIRSYFGLSCDLDSEFELIRSKMCKRMNVGYLVRKVDIPLYIKNTNDPEAAGTLIRESFPNDLEDDDSSTRFITGISGRKHFTIITLHKVGSPMVLRRSGAQGRGHKRCTDSRTAHINFAQVTLSLGRFCRKKPGLIRGRGPLCLIRL